MDWEIVEQKVLEHNRLNEMVVKMEETQISDQPMIPEIYEAVKRELLKSMDELRSFVADNLTKNEELMNGGPTFNAGDIYVAVYELSEGEIPF